MNENDLPDQLLAYGHYHDDKQEPIEIEDITAVPPRGRPAPIVADHRGAGPATRGLAIASAVGVTILLLVGGAVLLSRSAPTFDPASVTPTTMEPLAGRASAVIPQDALGASAGMSLPTGGTPLPDLGGAAPGDDGAGPVPLGVVNDLPGTERLDFLFEFCQPDCYRDAHFVDPNNPDVGSGPWPANRPFHIRHGFVNNGEEPLGEGFDVVVYVTSAEFGEFGVGNTGQTYRYASDYLLRGESDQCGPGYKTQSGPETCEWFVHDFPNGLPPGRHAIWAVWEAPCSAWVDLGLTASCADPDAVVSFFSSGVDSPFDAGGGVSFDEFNDARLTPAEIEERFGDLSAGFVEWIDEGEPFDVGPPIDASGAVANLSTTTPDFAGAVPGDDGSGPLPLGVVNELPWADSLDFLFEFCQPDCYRDAHFMDPNNPDVGSGPWTSGRPFHVRHGFVNTSDQPLGEGFDVVMYITLWDGSPDAAAQYQPGQTYRFGSDHVMRGTSDQCGPTYKTQTGSESCEWFVHDFPDGLPEGRYDLWAVWEAPCSAWVDLGFTDSCTDPNEVVSFFSSGVNSPFGPFEPSFTETNESQHGAPTTLGLAWPETSPCAVVQVRNRCCGSADRKLGRVLGWFVPRAGFSASQGVSGGAECFVSAPS